MQLAVIRQNQSEGRRETVHALVCTAIDAIPLTPNFISDDCKKRVRTECKDRNERIAERDGEVPE